MTTPNRTYLSNGAVLSSPPLTARLTSLATTIQNMLGLYFVSLFSLDPYTAAQNSRFNTRGRSSAYRTTNTNPGPSMGGGSAGGGGSGGSGGSGGMGPGRRMGTVDDVRGPECGSCG